MEGRRDGGGRVTDHYVGVFGDTEVAVGFHYALEA